MFIIIQVTGEEEEEDEDSERTYSFFPGSNVGKWPLETAIKNDRFGQPIVGPDSGPKISWNVSSIFNDRLGQIEEDYGNLEQETMILNILML
jgi:hypothetical protein